MAEKQSADIPESYFEYVVQFDTPMFGAWSIPNRIVETLYPKLQGYGVGLGDVTWSRETASAKDLQVVINIPRIRATLRVGLDSAVFNATNPDWSEAPTLLDVFSKSLAGIREAGRTNVASQEIALAMHVRPGDTPFKEVMASLVDVSRLGKAQAYGVVAYGVDSSLLLDRSVRYPDSLFIRLHRAFAPSVDFKSIAAALYEDESRALAIFGLQELMS